MQILAVVVRYKTSLSDSQTIESLTRIFAANPLLVEHVGVLIWDNSPSALVDVSLSFPVLYRHSAENFGVSGAYNRAMTVAAQQGCRWLLMLDQDTTLPDNFLSRMLELTASVEGHENIAAIAPFLVDGNAIISPGQLLFNRVRHIQPPFEGVHPGRMYAANSGTVMRLSALSDIGGFDESFWLDFSDIVAFHLLHDKGWRLYIAGDLRLSHRVTLSDYDGSMSPQRYMNFITAESAYWDLYRRSAEKMLQTCRLLLRAVRQFLRYRDKTYARLTFACFLRQVFWTKNSRLRHWKRQSDRRNLPAVSLGKVVG